LHGKFDLRNIVEHLKQQKMTAFKKLTGYNKNKFVKEEHVFIEGVGCFYETEELAKKHGHSKMIFTGVHVASYIHEGVQVFRTGATNVWD
jgi:hypothetical protein